MEFIQVSQTANDSGSVDVYSDISTVILPMETKVVSTGIKIKIPDGVCGFISSIPGVAIKNKIIVHNLPVDTGHDVCVIMTNLSNKPYAIRPGYKIAQMTLLNISKVNIVEQWH